MRVDKEFISQFEYMRIFAALSVILLHISSSVMTTFKPVVDWQWWIGNIIASATHWAVPVFIMISGALHIGKEVSIKHFFVKKFQRVALPLFVSIACFAIIYHYFRKDPLTFEFVIKRVIYDQPYEHLYFLFILLFLFLLTPFFNMVLKMSAKSFFILFVCSLIITLFWNPGRFIFTFWLPFVSYYLAGYLLFKYSQFPKVLLTIALMSSFLITIVGTATFTTQLIANQNGFYFFDYQSPTTIILSFCLYLLFLARGKKESLSKKIKTLASATYGVFLIHPVWIIFSRQMMQFVSITIEDTLIYLVTTFFITTLGSFLTVFFYQKLQAHHVVHTTSLLWKKATHTR